MCDVVQRIYNKGFEIGFEIGFAKGFEIGLKKGFEGGQKPIIIKMIKANYPDDEIINLTEVSETFLNQLKEELKSF